MAWKWSYGFRSPAANCPLGIPQRSWWRRCRAGVKSDYFLRVILSEARRQPSAVEEPALSERSESNGTPFAAMHFRSHPCTSYPTLSDFQHSRVERHSHHRVHAHPIERVDLLLTANTPRRDQPPRSQLSQTADNVQRNSLQQPFGIDVGVEERRTIRF